MLLALWGQRGCRFLLSFVRKRGVIQGMGVQSPELSASIMNYLIYWMPGVLQMNIFVLYFLYKRTYQSNTTPRPLQRTAPWPPPITIINHILANLGTFPLTLYFLSRIVGPSWGISCKRGNTVCNLECTPRDTYELPPAWAPHAAWKHE